MAAASTSMAATAVLAPRFPLRSATNSSAFPFLPTRISSSTPSFSVTCKQTSVSQGSSSSSSSSKSKEPQKQQFVCDLSSASLPLAAFALPFLLNPEDALAAGGEFGILEGRTASLLHPLAMGGLFVYTLYTGYLGWQWRRVRTIQTEINELKKQVQPVPVTPEGATTTSPTPSPLEVKIQQLTEERKELIKGQYKDKHFDAGSILLGFGVFEAIFGGLNTWFRTGKLFPGPHLFAGAGITVLWAVAAALVPAMQKGNETARNLHIAINGVNVLLFIWQIPTGIEILLKVLEFTKWP